MPRTDQRQVPQLKEWTYPRSDAVMFLLPEKLTNWTWFNRWVAS